MRTGDCAAGAVVIAAVLLLAGCGGGGSGAAGPLSAGTTKGTECAPFPAGRVLTDGADVLTGSEAATITAVTLEDPRGLRLVAAYVVPVAAMAPLYGVRPGWPPAAYRHPAAGASTAAGGRAVNLLLVVESQAGGGIAAGAVVSYKAGGHSYELTDEIGLTVVAGPSCPAGG